MTRPTAAGSRKAHHQLKEPITGGEHRDRVRTEGKAGTAPADR